MKKITISFASIEYLIIIWFMGLLFLPEVFMTNSWLILLAGIVIGTYNIGLTIILPALAFALFAICVFIYTDKANSTYNKTIKAVAGSVITKSTFFKQTVDIMMRLTIIYLAWQFHYNYLSVVSVIGLIIMIGFKLINNSLKIKIAKLTLLDNT